MLRTHELTVLFNSFVDRLIYQGFNISPHPILALLGNFIRCLFSYTVQLSDLLLEDLEEDTLSLLHVGGRDVKVEIKSPSSQDSAVHQGNSISCCNN
jgi:hypothetical protein